jgi:hypothetical protein
MRGVKNDKFFESLHERGKSITFDSNGIPIVQKPVKDLENESIEFIVSKEATV